MQYAKVERQIAGRTFSFETGRIAKQAAGAVLAQYGESMTLNTVCTAKPRPDIDFFPLSVDYREKLYANGKFPGGFMKREGRPSTKEILTCRLIDRPVRPMWPDGYQEEVQIMSAVVSADRENDPDLIAMNGSFAALHVSTLPFQGPLAAVRVGRVNGEFVAFPTIEELNEGDLDLIVAASSDAIVMVEGASYEISEEDFLEALDYARGICDELLDMQNELRRRAKPRASKWVAPEVKTHPVAAKVSREFGPKVRKTLMTEGKHEREEALDELKQVALEKYAPADAEDYAELKKAVSGAFSKLKGEMVRDLILEDGVRIDGRGLEDVRPITIDASLLPRAHGSVLFTRGETQAIVTASLGTPRDQQMVDTLMEEYSKRFDLHYNFPPFCVGEVRPVRGVGRREIGHGTLAERALASVVPPEETFPYTIRIVSDITESNGSSSMASVCGGTLAMMDAGVPIRQPVAGIAMGLVAEGGDASSGNFRVLSDILGTEDHVGDMDFKVAGTGRGITAVQMDIKIKGLTPEILRKALEQARRGRLHILREMMKSIAAPRSDISNFAPRLLQVRIPPEKIGLVIGPGGKTIKRIQEETGAKVEIDDEGVVSISSTDSQAAKDAKSFIEHLTAEVEVGRVYEGRVVSIKDFGCFVEVLPGQEGLCHVSELDFDRVDEVTDVVSLGDTIPVKVLLRDEQGRLKLSRRAALEEGDGGPAPRGEGGGDEGGDRPPRREPRGDDRGPRGRDDDRGPRGRDGDRRPPRRDDDRPPRRDGDRDRPPRRSRDDDRPRRREGGGTARRAVMATAPMAVAAVLASRTERS